MKHVYYVGREEGCPACHALRPQFEEFCKSKNIPAEKVTFVDANAEDDATLDLLDKLRIRSVPTVIFISYKDSEFRVVGNDIEAMYHAYNSATYDSVMN